MGRKGKRTHTGGWHKWIRKVLPNALLPSLPCVRLLLLPPDQVFLFRSKSTKPKRVPLLFPRALGLRSFRGFGKDNFEEGKRCCKASVESRFAVEYRESEHPGLKKSLSTNWKEAFTFVGNLLINPQSAFVGCRHHQMDKSVLFSPPYQTHIHGQKNRTAHIVPSF